MESSNQRKHSSESRGIEKTSPRGSDNSKLVVKWLDLMAQTYQTEVPTPELTRLWLETLVPYPSVAIDEGFRSHTRHGKFPPRPADIAEYCEEWMTAQEGKSSQQDGQELDRIKALRARKEAGEEFYGMDDIADMVKNFTTKRRMP